MAGICTETVSPGGCDHRNVTVNLDGTLVTVHLDDSEAMTPLTPEDRQQFVRLAIRRLRQQGVPLANFLNRVTHGDEATNVKLYSLFGPGSAITKTNIGTTYVNICPGLNGEPIPVDFTGCTQYRIMMHANLVGTGQWGVRVLRDNNDVLHENANIGAAGERELNLDWTNLPAAFQGIGLVLIRAQAKSTTGADDPVFRAMTVGLR